MNIVGRRDFNPDRYSVEQLNIFAHHDLQKGRILLKLDFIDGKRCLKAVLADEMGILDRLLSLIGCSNFQLEKIVSFLDENPKILANSDLNENALLILRDKIIEHNSKTATLFSPSFSIDTRMLRDRAPQLRESLEDLQTEIDGLRDGSVKDKKLSLPKNLDNLHDNLIELRRYALLYDDKILLDESNSLLEEYEVISSQLEIS